MGGMQDAQDAIDRIILQQAADRLGGAAGRITVLEDMGGIVSALPPGVGPVRVHSDSWMSEQRVAARASRTELEVSLDPTLGPAVLAGAQLVLLRLPKSLAALEEIAELVAAVAAPDVLLVGGGRDKHMTRGMNAVLSRHFSDVSASLGQQKCRVLFAARPDRTVTSSYPRREWHDDLQLTVCAHGAAFAGTSIDLGTRYLLGFLDRMAPAARSVVDLGCGTGVLATVLARRLSEAQVLAVDDSAAACRSTGATAEANDVADRVTVRRADALHGTSDHLADLIVCNPPFHRGTTRDSSSAFDMFAGAARVLRRGGELWTVFNSHLPYLPALRRRVGPTQVIGQNRAYVVTRSVAAAGVQE
jgi:16S rRNA (guanine1207-N2)-methyltransferase